MAADLHILEQNLIFECNLCKIVFGILKVESFFKKIGLSALETWKKANIIYSRPCFAFTVWWERTRSVYLIELSEHVSGDVPVTGTQRSQMVLRVEGVIEILKELISMQVW